MQADSGKSRGCKNNIFILAITINYLFIEAGDAARMQGIITYIDFLAVFNSILLSYKVLQIIVRVKINGTYSKIVHKRTKF